MNNSMELCTESDLELFGDDMHDVLSKILLFSLILK